MRDIVKAINDRQHLPANGNRDWPFHIVLGANVEKSGGQTLDFWPLCGNDRYYNPSILFKDYIDAIAACWPTGAGAKVIISLLYYPWATLDTS
ncbi:MAG: hypothetical protein GYA34_17025, partial [Chloroflexi bacterium]|nr:hypothetical protein [Chloroflexota bacterium]